MPIYEDDGTEHVRSSLTHAASSNVLSSLLAQPQAEQLDGGLQHLDELLLQTGGGDDARSSGSGASDEPPAELPETWKKLFDQLLPNCSSYSQAELSECAAACEEGLREQRHRPVALRIAMLHDVYMLKQDLVTGSNGAWKVVEGLERQTRKNYSLKMIAVKSAASLRGRDDDESSHKLNMQAFYSICSFIEEALYNPSYVCIVFKWGLHEMDTNHQLSCLVLDAIQLLLELLPDELKPPKQQCLRIGKGELQRVLLRSMALDTFLQSNLFLQ